MLIYTFAEFELDLTLYQLRQGDCVVELGPRNFDVLTYLVRHRDRLVGKEELVERVWGVSAMSGSSVPTAIAAVRRALGDDPAAPVFIETVRGRGYRFVAEVGEQRDDSGLVPGSKVAEGEGRYAFVGREAELAALYAAFEHALGRTPQLVLVVGEAGIGKTRTLEEFVPLVREDGASVLVGHCREDEGAPAFWPWMQIVRACVEQGPPAGLLEILGDLAPDLARMAPDLRERFPGLSEPPEMEAEQARFRLFEAVTAFVRAAAAERPLLLWLDDLHRADVASLALLRFAVSDLRDAQVLFVATYRDADLQRDPEKTSVIASIARAEPSRSLQLQGLGRDEVRALVADALDDQTPPEALTHALYEQTEGNPFFLTQLVHLLEAEGRLSTANLGGSERISLPGGIREAVARQLDVLDPEARRVISVASVFGREFPSSVLASAMRSEKAEVSSAIESALGARLLALAPGTFGHYRFTHVLVRDAVYDLLEAEERRRLHAVIGEALEDLQADRLDAHAAELAHHFLAASTADANAKAIRYSRLAGEWSTSRLGYEDAPAHFRRALDAFDLTPNLDPLERCDLLLALGEAQMRAADRAGAESTLKETVDLARELDDANRLGRAVLALAPGFFAIEVGVFDPVLVALLEEALEALGDSPSALRAQLLARQAMALTWSNAGERRAELSLEAIAIARQSGDAVALAHALSARHGDLWAPEKFPERLELIDELGTLVTHPREAELSLLHRVFHITALLEDGQIHAVDQEIDSFSRLAAELRQPHSLWYADLYRAMRALMEGRFEEAEGLAIRFAAAGGKAQDLNALQSLGAQIAIVRWEQGRGSEMQESIRQYAMRHPAVSAWRACLAYLYGDLGDTQRCRLEFERIAAAGFSQRAWTETSTAELYFAAEVCHVLGDAARAELIYGLLEPARDRHVVVGYGAVCFGAVARALGLLATTIGEWELATSHFEAALTKNLQVGATPYLARTHLQYAQMLMRKGGGRSHVESLLDEGASLARLLGMTHLQSQISAASAVLMNS